MTKKELIEALLDSRKVKLHVEESEEECEEEPSPKVIWPPSGYVPCHFDHKGNCDGPERYPTHFFSITQKDIDIENYIESQGYHGRYRPSFADPGVHTYWVCRRHFFDYSMGMKLATCAECGEEFAFDDDHVYTEDDDDEVFCPICKCVVYSNRRKSLWELKQEWFNDPKVICKECSFRFGKEDKCQSCPFKEGNE